MIRSLSFTFLWLAALSFLFFSCSQNELREQNTALQSELDSLSIILNETETAVETLGEIGVLLDTIESQRSIIRLELVEGGIQYQDYVKRIEALNEYMAQAETRISKLEKSKSSYSSLVKKLRGELEEKNRQLVALKAIMDDFKADNVSLRGTVQLQEAQIDDMELDIVLKEQELDLLEAKIQEMIEVSKMSEADGYYARGVAYEEAARRTRLAPRKKKETLKRALELYQQALDLGHEGAAAKVEELNKQLN